MCPQQVPEMCPQQVPVGNEAAWLWGAQWGNEKGRRDDAVEIRPAQTARAWEAGREWVFFWEYFCSVLPNVCHTG